MSNRPQSKVFLEGRYRKLSRDLPQTVFFCPECKGHPRRRKGCAKCEGFGKLTRDSVQELIGWVVGKAFGTRKHKFHGAGREDVDVRMLGEGRPFVFELVNPSRSDVDLAELEETINARNEGRLEVLGLHWTEKERVRVLKEGKHAKRYQVLAACEGELESAAVDSILGTRVSVEQKTPERVAHRRADKTRTRWVEVEAVEPAEAGQLTVTLKTEHGTYVKEFVSGEDGKTVPSLGELLGGVRCRCEALDVLGVLGEEGGELDVVRGPEPPAPFGLGLD